MWIARNQDDSLWLFEYKPHREYLKFVDEEQKDALGYWEGEITYDNGKGYVGESMPIEYIELFSNLKWEDEPVEVDIMPSDFLKKLLLDIKSNIRSGKYDGDLWNLFDDLLEICGYQEINLTLTKTIH